MGTFGNSFSREIGKNTGKVVSNAVFGDKWSTPHRINSSVNIKVAEIKAVQAKADAEATIKKSKIEYDAQIDKIELEQEFEREKIEMEQEFQRQKMEAKLLKDIIKTSYSNDSNSNYQILTELWSLVQSHESESIKKAAVSKIEDGIFKMKQLGSNEESAFFENRLSEYKIKKLKDYNKKKLITTIFIILGVIIGIPVLYYLFKSQQESQHMIKHAFKKIFD